jgi:2-keto-4-pentenoate hydratase
VPDGGRDLLDAGDPLGGRSEGEPECGGIVGGVGAARAGAGKGRDHSEPEAVHRDLLTSHSGSGQTLRASCQDASVEEPRNEPVVDDPAAVARRLVEARARGETLDVPLSAAPGGLSLDDAYRIQAEVTALRQARGEQIVGWKLGYTSLAMRQQMGVDAPNYGPLTDAMLLAPPGPVPPGALHPRVEPEIGLRLARRLAGPCTIADVLAASDVALACLEVVDSIWTGYRFALEDNTADGSSAAWVVVGSEVPIDDLPGLRVELSVDGSVVASSTGAAASGHPAAGVAWLAEQLGARGLALEPGQLVITGGLTAAHPRLPVFASRRGRRGRGARQRST